MAKLLKLRRGTTSQHGSFTGAEGEVTIDTDKETAVVHDGSTAGGHALAKETMTNVSSASIAGRFADDAINPTKIAGGTLGTDVKVADGNINGNLTIENADVTNTAAIAGTKITPAFGSQNLSTSGTAATGALTVTGNIGVSGTVDGRDVASDGSKLDGIEASATADQTAAEIKTLVGSASDSNVFTDADHAKLDALTTSNGVILNGVTATTQSAGDASTKVATTAYTDTAITNLVDSSPSALNTLNELAAAIGDDANFSTTITNSIAGKLATNGNGASVTNLNASALASGTIPDARFPSTLPAVSGANLTGIVSFVSGMIIIWSGSTGSIPSGWVLCNGSNSTPDLRDRFVVGAGNSYGVGNTGGSTTRSDTVNISGSDTVNISGSDTVNISVSGNAQGDIRQYGGINTYYATGYNHNSNAKLDLTHHVYTGTRLTIPFSGSGSDTVNISGSDTVNISGSDTVNIDTRSPYYALCYIMKT